MSVYKAFGLLTAVSDCLFLQDCFDVVLKKEAVALVPATELISRSSRVPLVVTRFTGSTDSQDFRRFVRNGHLRTRRLRIDPDKSERAGRTVNY